VWGVWGVWGVCGVCGLIRRTPVVAGVLLVEMFGCIRRLGWLLLG